MLSARYVRASCGRLVEHRLVVWSPRLCGVQIFYAIFAQGEPQSFDGPKKGEENEGAKYAITFFRDECTGGLIIVRV